MALIQCAECNSKVSTKAKACPHCGAPVEPSLEPSLGSASFEDAQKAPQQEQPPPLIAQEATPNPPASQLMRLPQVAPAPPAASSTVPQVYHLSCNGDQRGPYTLEQLRGMWQSGDITADTYYWGGGMDGWEPIAALLRAPRDVVKITNPPPISTPTPWLTAQSQPTLYPNGSPDFLAVLWKKGIKRRHYWGFFLVYCPVAVALTLYFAANIEIAQSICYIIGAIIGLPLNALRLRNIGYNPWLTLLGPIPFISVVIGIPCSCFPEDYATTQKLDTTAKVLLGIMGTLILLSLFILVVSL